MDEIAIGTTFREQMIDGDPLWKVVEKLGEDRYLCRVEEEDVWVDGESWQTGWAGVKKEFTVQEILGLLGDT